MSYQEDIPTNQPTNAKIVPIFPIALNPTRGDEPGKSSLTYQTRFSSQKNGPHNSGRHTGNYVFTVFFNSTGGSSGMV